MKKPFSSLFIVSLVIILDQLSKYVVIRFMDPFDSIKVFPFLHILHVQNPGAAFGMFRNMASSFFITISFAAIIFVIYLLRKKAYHPLGLSFILGGAIGNLIDRILYGKVVDFIDFSIGDFHWYTFNIADSALTIGVAIIILSLLFQKKG